MADVPFDRTAASNYLKVQYGKAGVYIYNTQYPSMGMVTKEYGEAAGLKGSQFEETIELDPAVGVGCGDQYPDATIPYNDKVTITSKNTYSTGLISRKLMKTATGGASAFIDSQKRTWWHMQDGYAWMQELFFHGSGDGSIGTISTVTDADPTFTIVITDATWNEHKWRRNMLVNVGTGTDVFRVTATTKQSKQVTLARQTGSDVPTTSDVIYLQNSKDKAPYGYEYIFDATYGSTSLYGITAQDQWMPGIKDASSATIDEEMIDDEVLEREAITGEGPNWFTTSLLQWKILKSQNTDLKRYVVPNPNVPKKYAAKFGFMALEYCSPAGQKVIPIMYNRFVKDSVFNLFNRDYVKVKHVAAPEFFDEDGTVFLRSPNKKDHYEAQYGAYCDTFFYPTYHAQIQNLATS